MADIRITDLVDPKAIEDLKAVQQEMNAAKTVYLEVVRAVAQGIKIKVETTGDIDKLNGLIAQEAKKAEAATVQLNGAIQKQQQVLAQTTPEISRHLAEIQKENQAKRDAYKIDQESVVYARRVIGTLSENSRQMARLRKDIDVVKASKKELDKAYKEGTVTEDAYISRSADLISRQNQLKVSMSELQSVMNNQSKQAEANGGSYQQLSLQLEEMKKAYKSLTPEEKESSESAKKLADEINRLDAHLKDAAGDMGEFQRNTGNYAIAANKYVDVLFRAVGLNGQFGRSLQALAVSGTGNFLADLNVKVRALGASLGTLLANPYVLAILGIAGTVMAVKWWYDYNKGLMTATRLTREFLDVHGDRLVSIRSEIQAIADEYGKDYKEVLQGVDTLTSQWKIDSEAALRVIRDGFQAGTDENGRFLGMIQQYAPIFKDMKAEASEMVAVLAQTRSGIFNEQGLAMLQMALKNLRDMQKGTHDSLQAIGVDVDAWIRKLNTGEADYLDFIVEISKKMKETNDQSQAFGAVMGDLFGRKGTAGGAELVKYLGEMTTEMEKVKAVTGEVGKLRDQHIQKQKELNEAVAGLFDMTDDGFEEMTLKGKNYITDVLIKIVEAIEDIVNWFKRTYDQSEFFRGSVLFIASAFGTVWEVAKVVFGYIVNSYKVMGEGIVGIGEALIGAFNLDWDKMQSGIARVGTAYSDFFKGVINDAKVAGQHIYDLTLAASNDFNSHDYSGRKGKNKREQNRNINKSMIKSDLSNGDDGDDSGNKTAKAQKQQEEIRQVVLEAVRETIRQRLAIVEKGSEEELALQKELAEAEYQLTVLNAGKTFADRKKKLDEAQKSGKVSAKEYNEGLASLTEERTQAEVSAEKLKLKAIEEAQKSYNERQIELISQRYSKEQEMSSADIVLKQSDLKEAYASGLISKEEYEAQSLALTQQYAIQSAQAVISRLEEQLSLEDLTAEQREQLSRELNTAKANLAKEAADAEIAQMERTVAADKKAAQERQRNMQKWLQTASRAIGSVGKLLSQLYQNEIDALDEEGDVAQEHYDKEVERITQLEETGAITKEEAEARKASAASRREQKEEELEKRKAELMYKQALWEKMTAVAQAGIQTALGVTSALAMFPPNIALAAVVGAMGAVEVATILATPIKAYAKGTPKGGHQGGMAVVGDGGREEVVTYKGNAWLTPDTPTLVNLPKGAEVFPDADEFDVRKMLPLYSDRFPAKQSERPVIVNNDYRRLEQKMERNNQLLKMAIMSERELAYRQAFRNYYNGR